LTALNDLSLMDHAVIPAPARFEAGAGPAFTSWPANRDRLALHGPLWAQDGLTYFRASTVDWA
jgi:hypothetical protein